MNTAEATRPSTLPYLNQVALFFTLVAAVQGSTKLVLSSRKIHFFYLHIYSDIRQYRTIQKYVAKDSSGSGQGPVAGSCEHGNEPSGSIIIAN
jgi:hypothetical protein